MSEDMDRAIGQLKNMLSTEEGQKELEGIIGNVQGMSHNEQLGEIEDEPQGYNLPAKSSTPFSMDALMRVRSIMDGIQTGDDPRVNLLTALRPYISQNRGHHIDNAIKIMSLGKIPYLLKNMKK